MTLLFITAVHLHSGAGHEHVATVRWLNPTTGKAGDTSRAEMIRWLEESEANTAKVAAPNGPVQVGVVDDTPPYLRTYANKSWTDNLLNLARY